MPKLFDAIAKLNSVLFLCLLLISIFAVSFIFFDNNRWRNRGAVEVRESASPNEPAMLLNVERLESILGANTQMIRLTTEGKSEKFSSGGNDNQIRNILFLTGKEKEARWLFADHKRLILNVSQLRDERRDLIESPTKALYFEFVEVDNNNDGKLTASDSINIALTQPDGTGFLEILKNINRVHSHDILDKEFLSIVYQKSNTIRHAKFTIKSRKLVVDQQILALPNKI